MALPLITYSPRYHELEGVAVQYEDGKRYIPETAFLHQKQHLKVQITLPTQKTLAAYFMINDPSFNPSVLQDFYFVFGVFNSPEWSKGGQIHLLDNRGNLYSIAGGLVPGTSFPQLGVPYDTSPYQNYYGTMLGDLTKAILPDSFIDVRVNEARAMVKPGFYFPTKPMTDVIPHRAFQPTRDLADYIEILEKGRGDSKKGVNTNTQTNTVNKGNMNTQTVNSPTTSVNVQTNMPSTMNTGVQANGRNGFVNALRKTCSGKACNAINEGVQVNRNTTTNTNRKNRNGFVKTLRKACRGKNCNAANTGVQTNSAYTGRRHSMVNVLRKTVRNARKE